MKIDIGAGDAIEHGWISWDIKDGKDARDLSSLGRSSVDEIRACHVLEHIPMRDTLPTLVEWRASLKSGGRLFVAVPDFMWCFARMLDGTQDPNLERYIMGGQIDEHDFHFALFWEAKLQALLDAAGFIRISRMGAEGQNCSLHPCSLNMEAFVP